jgi:hypothetical protein
MPIGLLTLDLHLPACSSLKEKRSRLKPLLARLHREFNVSAAEMDHQDTWQSSRIGCALLGNDPAYLQRSLRTVVHWLEQNWPDVSVMDDKIEIL